MAPSLMVRFEPSSIHQWNPNYPTKATRGKGKKVDGYVACIMDDKDKM